MNRAINLLIISIIAIWSFVSSLEAQERKIAHWSFDDCTSKDSGYVKMNGTLIGSPQCIKSIKGNGLHFDGKDDHIEMSRDILIIPRDTITITAWVRRGNEGLAAILTKFENSGEMEWWFGLYDGDIHFTTQNSGGCGSYCKELMSSNLDIQKDTWTWIGIIIEGNKVSYMKNGKILDYDYNNYDFKPGKSLVQIGRKNTKGTEYDYYKGELDEVVIYEGALTSKQLDETFNEYRWIDLNNYYTAVEAINDSSIEVTDISKCRVGDKILIIQMQGASVERQEGVDYGKFKSLLESGNYEFNQIKQFGGKSGRELILNKPIINKYALSGNIQVVGLPHYTKDITIEDTISCPKWDGKTGGVYAICCDGSINLQAPIDVSGKGFSGGIAKNSDAVITENVTNYISDEKTYLYSFKGEGISINLGGGHLAGRGAIANAGGGGNSHNAGGGGGANGGCGGTGGMGFKDAGGNYEESGGIGGYGITTTPTKTFMGGGGGAGHGNEKTSTNGGDGGGIIFVIANELHGKNGKLIANGTNAQNSYYDGAGGGGGGGSILLKVGKIEPDIQVEAVGGNGGRVTEHFDGPGGGGGGGVIHMYDNCQPPSNVVLRGGYSGVQRDLSSYGARDGCNGTIQKDANFTGDDTKLILDVKNDGELINQAVFEVFPNPTHGVITIANSQKFTRYKLIDVLGRVICEGNLNNKTSIDISAVEMGIYYISMFNSTECQVRKIIKN